MTRRGRGLVRFVTWCAVAMGSGLAIAAVVLVVSSFAAPGAAAGDGSVRDGRSTVSVVVGPGDSLWSLAVRSQPGRDPRDVVADIESLNGLTEGSVLPVGARLLVPTA